MTNTTFLLGSFILFRMSTCNVDSLLDRGRLLFLIYHSTQTLLPFSMVEVAILTLLCGHIKGTNRYVYAVFFILGFTLKPFCDGIQQACLLLAERYIHVVCL